MDQSVAVSPIDADREPEQKPAKNDLAHAASIVGIIGFVLLAGVMALAANALITALTIPDFMPDDATIDPFAVTCLACVLPFFLGCIGLSFGIAAIKAASVHGQRRVAIRGLLFGIVNLLLPIAIGVVFFNFDLATAACGGG
jgi:hypothetical protein